MIHVLTHIYKSINSCNRKKCLGIILQMIMSFRLTYILANTHFVQCPTFNSSKRLYMWEWYAQLSCLMSPNGTYKFLAHHQKIAKVECRPLLPHVTHWLQQFSCSSSADTTVEMPPSLVQCHLLVAIILLAHCRQILVVKCCPLLSNVI